MTWTYLHKHFMNQEKNRGIYYEPLRLYFSEKKKIVEGHIDMDHLIRKGEIVPITAEEYRKKIELQT